MVLRDFRCVSARAAYRGVKNVDLRPLFLLWREEGFSILRPIARNANWFTNCESACTEQFVWTYMRYIFFSAENI